MSVIAAATTAAVVGGLGQAYAAGEAADAQVESAQAGISEQQRQFDEIVELLSPYVDAGTGAIQAQEALAGLGDPGAQQQAIEAIEQGPQFQALLEQGERALLQNASATGGLRTSNTQQSLAQFRPQLLSQLIESQFQKLGSISAQGQASAAGQASAGQNASGAITNLLQQQGAAQAGESLAQGQALGNVTNSLGSLATLQGLGIF